MDKACTGLEAFCLLVPDGWAFQGGLKWSVDNTMMPATCGFKITGDGIEVQALPGQAFFWTSLPQVRLSHPVGSRYLGAMVCPPLNPAEFLNHVMLPALRPDASDLAIVCESGVVDMGSTLGYEATFEHSGSASSGGAMVRVKYLQGGREYEEELYCTITSFAFTIQAGGSRIHSLFWIADHLFSFRAESGRLDRAKDVLQAMMYSFRTNPRWLAKSNRIVLYLKDRQVHKPSSLRQLSVDVDRETILPEDSPLAYEQHQSAYRWIADSLGEGYAAGEYYDPIQQICVRLPAGYDFAWASDAGEYLLSNRVDPAFDYNCAGKWKPMEPIPVDSSSGEPSAAPATCA